MQVFYIFKIQSIFTFKLAQNYVAACDNELYLGFFHCYAVFVIMSKARNQLQTGFQSFFLSWQDFYSF